MGLGVIGAGYWGSKLARNALQNASLDVRYVCDLDVDRAETVLGEYSTVHATSSIEQVLTDPSVAAVAIATPAATHAEVVSSSLAAGKHVLVEKPLAPNVEDALKLVRTAEDRGLVLMLDYTYCYAPVVTRLRELIRGGEIGALQYLDSVRINFGLVRDDVDVLWDLASHDVAIVHSICPIGAEPVSVAAHGADPLGLGRVSVGYLSIRLANGGIAHTHVNWLSPTKVRTMIVSGSRRTLVWNDLDPRQRLSIYDMGVQVASGEDGQPPTYRVGDMVAPALPEGEALGAVMESFARAILHGDHPETDGRVDLRVLATLEAAHHSISSDGSFVPLDLPSEPVARRP